MAKATVCESMGVDKNIVEFQLGLLKVSRISYSKIYFISKCRYVGSQPVMECDDGNVMIECDDKRGRACLC